VVVRVEAEPAMSWCCRGSRAAPAATVPALSIQQRAGRW
jgi:hypothetical protein